MSFHICLSGVVTGCSQEVSKQCFEELPALKLQSRAKSPLTDMQNPGKAKLLNLVP